MKPTYIILIILSVLVLVGVYNNDPESSHPARSGWPAPPDFDLSTTQPTTVEGPHYIDRLMEAE